MSKLEFKSVRPTCMKDGCHKPCKRRSRICNDGSQGYYKYCCMCQMNITAKNKGMTLIDYKNSLHPYRYARLTYCENVDSRLGFRCTTTIMITAQLEVDHIDGYPRNNEVSNLQTLCSCCHKYKTSIYGDNLSPGRKQLGITY